MLRVGDLLCASEYLDPTRSRGDMSFPVYEVESLQDGDNNFTVIAAGVYSLKTQQHQRPWLGDRPAASYPGQRYNGRNWGLIKQRPTIKRPLPSWF